MSIKFPRWFWSPSVWGPTAWVNSKSIPSQKTYLLTLPPHNTGPATQTKQLIQVYHTSDLTWVSHINIICLGLKSQLNGLRSQVHTVISFTPSQVTSQLTFLNSIFANSMHSRRLSSCSLATRMMSNAFRRYKTFQKRYHTINFERK